MLGIPDTLSNITRSQIMALNNIGGTAGISITSFCSSSSLSL
jgi:hypothetical protein